MNLNKLKDEFLLDLTEYSACAESTKDGYNFDLTNFIEYLHKLSISESNQLSVNLIENYLRELKNKKTYSRLAPTTKARIRSSIKSFLVYSYRQDYIKTNLGAKLKKIKIPSKDPEYLSREQYSHFIKTIEREATPFYRERDLALVKLLIKSGLRQAEVVSLNTLDVDLSKLMLKVKRKGNKEEYVYIHHELADDLNRYLKIIESDKDRPLFLSKRGNRLSASSVWHLIKMYSHKAGLNGDVTVHSLRHTFATILLSENLPIPTIQRLMGHKSPTTTFRYLHLTNPEIIEQFNKVNFEEGR